MKWCERMKGVDAVREGGKQKEKKKREKLKSRELRKPLYDQYDAAVRWV